MINDRSGAIVLCTLFVFGKWNNHSVLSTLHRTSVTVVWNINLLSFVVKFRDITYGNTE